MNIPKYYQLVGTICSGLVMFLPTISSVAIAQPIVQPTTSKVNPCPGIFYEEPYNYRILVPVGCPPNALTLRLMQLGIIPFIITPLPDQNRFGVGGEAPSSLNPNPSIFNEPPYNRSQPQNNFQSALPTRRAVTPLQPPAPAQRQEPSTKIALVDGKANVKLINNTNAKITYQVIGDTAPRVLEGKSDVTLRGLSTPITVTFEREDGGLLMVTPQAGKDKGSLDVTLKETTDVEQDRSAMSIQSNGSVFLN
jgi:hypothetical protein